MLRLLELELKVEKKGDESVSRTKEARDNNALKPPVEILSLG